MKMIESFIQKSCPCQVVSPLTKSIPTKTAPLIRSSWIMHPGSSDLCKLFCCYRTPEILVTDNGPQFINTEIKALLK